MLEMKDSGIQWIGVMPNSWNIDRIKPYFDIISGSGFKDSIQGQENGDFPVCKASDISQAGHIMTFAVNYISRQQVVREGFKIIPKGSILFPKIGEALKKNNRTLTAVECCADNNCQALVPREMHPNYAYYLLKCIDMAWFDNAGTVPCLNNTKLKNCSIPVPDEYQQRQIADYLDSKCSEIDALSADIQKEIETLEEYKKSLVSMVVLHGLNDSEEKVYSGFEWIGYIPKTWKLSRSKYLFEQRNERGNSVELQLLSPTQKYGVIPQSLYEELTGMSAVKLNDKTDFSKLKTIHKGDFCISLRSFQGGFEHSKYEGVVSPAYQVFYATVPIVEGYYKYLFKDQSFIDKLNSYTMSLRDGKNIAFSDFGNTYIPVPPISEQQNIFNFLNKKCTEIDSVIIEKRKQATVLEEYKKSIIYEYVTGKKEVPACE